VAKLADGPHTVDVRARDDLGNVGSAERATFIVATPPAAPLPATGPGDVEAPQTVITQGSVATRSTRPVFAVGSSEAGTTFGCRVGSGPFQPCSSPWRPTKLKEGSYRFEVRATDAAGNTDATPARRQFRVDRTLVRPRVSVSGRQRVRGTTVRVAAKGGAGEAVTVSVSGSVRVSGRRGSLKLRATKRKAAGKRRVSVNASLSKTSSRTVRSALKRGRRVTVRLRVSVADAAGNRSARTRTVRLLLK
jgi:hypothetical protein